MFDAAHRIALHAEDRLSAERRRAHDLGLQGKPIAITTGNVDDRPHALLPRESYRSQRRHPRLASVVVGQPDDIDGVGQNGNPVADRAPSAWAGSEISADVRAVSDMTAEA